MRVFARSDVYKLPVSVVTVQNRIIARSEIEIRLAVVEISKKRNKASKKSIETKQSKGYNKFGKFTFRNLKFYLRSENYEKIVF